MLARPAVRAVRGHGNAGPGLRRQALARIGERQGRKAGPGLAGGEGKPKRRDRRPGPAFQA